MTTKNVYEFSYQPLLQNNTRNFFSNAETIRERVIQATSPILAPLPDPTDRPVSPFQLATKERGINERNY